MRSEKIKLVKDIGKVLGESEYVFLISYKGLKVKDITELRRSLGRFKTVCRILKNRLILKASSEIGLQGFSSLKLTGDTAVVFGSGDPSPVAKAIMDFAKTHEMVKAKNGLYEGRPLNSLEIKQISELPPLDVLRSQFLGVLTAPSRNLVNVLYMKSSEILNVLNAFKEKLENKN
jgi:large subunit ribosomal protein L10